MMLYIFNTFACFSRLGSFPTDSIKYANAVTAAPTHNAVFVAFLRKFLLHYNWTTIFLLCDDKQDVGYFRVSCANSKKQLTAPIFKLHFVNFDSGMEAVNYNSYLDFVQEAARAK